MARELSLARAFVELADTLVADFDVVDFLHVLANRCVELVGVQAAGLMLADQRGQLRLMASSSEQGRLLELFELESDEGPCLTCFDTGQPTSDTTLEQADPRWPRFGRQAADAGFQSVHALPLKLRTDVIGVLNLFSSSSVRLSDDDLQIGQALADVATIALLQHRAIEHRQLIAEQLQGALNNRVLVEQAKGVIAERQQVDMEHAFKALRAYARRRSQRLSDVALDIIEGNVETAELDIRKSDGPYHDVEHGPSILD
jgi:transcriptional regulator with GAF, ATPase, and Fis domain